MNKTTILIKFFLSLQLL